MSTRDRKLYVKKSKKRSNNAQRHFTGDYNNIRFRKKGIYFVTAYGTPT